jgi:hypothetical protein
LHEVLDEWFVRQVVPRLVGRAVLVRYADDEVVIFEREPDARRVIDVLPKRLAKYGLTLHPEKTRLVDFRRPDQRADERSRPGTFNLLGFTHSWAKSRKGHWVVKQKTTADRFRRALKRIANWCRQYRHGPVREQWTALKRKLLGHFVYFGITGNFRALRNFRLRVIGVWRKWLSRRSQRAWISWGNAPAAGALSAATAAYPSLHRRVAKPWAEEPDAGDPHVRIRGSLGGAIPWGDPTNLGNLWRRLALPAAVANWSLTSLQQRLVKTGGRLIKHARYYWLLLAESHLTRRLFGGMLQRILTLPVPAG